MAADQPGLYDIIGFVRNAGGDGIKGVTMTLTGGSGGSIATDSAGFYGFWDLAGGITYTVAPSRDYCTFSPVSREYPDLSQDYGNQNYTASCTLYNISGALRKPGGGAISGFTVVLSGAADDTATTDSKGAYAFTELPGGFDYTVTPIHEDCTFTPESRAYPNLSQNYTAQDYTGDCSAGVPETPPTTWGSIKAMYK
jgi:hypothetical protein